MLASFLSHAAYPTSCPGPVSSCKTPATLFLLSKATSADLSTHLIYYYRFSKQHSLGHATHLPKPFRVLLTLGIIDNTLDWPGLHDWSVLSSSPLPVSASSQFSASFIPLQPHGQKHSRLSWIVVIVANLKHKAVFTSTWPLWDLSIHSVEAFSGFSEHIPHWNSSHWWIGVVYYVGPAVGVAFWSHPEGSG